MTRKFLNQSRRYQAALQKHLEEGQRANLESARGMNRPALADGLETRDLVMLHEQILTTKVLPRCPARQRPTQIRQAACFFAAAIAPVETSFQNVKEATDHLKEFVQILTQRTVELAAANAELNQEISQRKTAEEALKKSERHYSALLDQSEQMQEQLRQLSRQVISAQEDERKKISRELHDVIAQTLTGINIRLANLKKEALVSTKGLDRNIARTQRLVVQSVNIVHQFARELRPAVLDDLGLLAALHTLMKNFARRAGVRTRLSAFAGVEELDIAKRTVLFRVAQEALTNVARHAEAQHVIVTIRKLPDWICMKIADDGKSFQTKRTMSKSGTIHLGLLGMRERLEMAGGHFLIESSKGKGTTIEARLPLPNSRFNKAVKKTHERSAQLL